MPDVKVWFDWNIEVIWLTNRGLHRDVPLYGAGLTSLEYALCCEVRDRVYGFVLHSHKYAG